MVNDILDISKIEAGELKLNEVDIHLPSALDECIKVIGGWKQTKDLSIEREVSPSLPRLRADERLLQQITLNLLSNAVKFNNTGGKVVLSCGLAGDNSIEIAVTDNGWGIPEGDLEKVLEPFGQARADAHESHEGTGLGLALSKQLVELHEGRLKLESTLGVGTRVAIIFPAHRTITAGT